MIKKHYQKLPEIPRAFLTISIREALHPGYKNLKIGGLGEPPTVQFESWKPQTERSPIRRSFSVFPKTHIKVNHVGEWHLMLSKVLMIWPAALDRRTLEYVRDAEIGFLAVRLGNSPC